MKKSANTKNFMLFVATLLLLVNFWAWSLISPLATGYAEHYSLSAFTLSLLVASPVMIGSLGRIPLGLLADRYGGRNMFVLVSWLSAAAVIGLSLAGSTNTLLLAAIGLGVAGASFAVGIPFVNAWFPKKQRGLAHGIYATGYIGTAVSGLLTPYLAGLVGQSQLFWLIAGLLVVAGIFMLLVGRESPSWKPAKGGIIKRIKLALKWDLTWKLSLLYALTFGAFVTFGLYLPILLNQTYGLNASDAAARAAGFVILATIARPIGGWLSDKVSGLTVIRASFLSLFIFTALVATQPGLAPVGTIAYLAIAVALGIGSGAVFAVVGHRANPKLIGIITGIIGAAGGLGGYFPLLVMGLNYQLFGSYSAALGLFAVICLLVVVSLRRLFGYGNKY